MHLAIAIILFCVAIASPVGRREGVATSILINKLTQRAQTTEGAVKQHCPPSKWSDYLSFYLGNYFAHVATVQTYPGESLPSTIQALLVALLFPAAGVSRGLTTIIRFAILQKTPLQTAARAGALCMVVRTKEWEPLSDEQPVDGMIVRSSMKNLPNRKLGILSSWIGALQKSLSQTLSKTLSSHTITLEEMEESGSPFDNIEIPRELKVYWPPWAQELSDYWHFYDTYDEHIDPGQSVHGFCKLSTGYALAHVPRDAVISPLGGLDSKRTLEAQYPAANTVSASHSFLKASIAVLQLLYAAFTLGRSFNGQIMEYGYASFGLTVTPYALMSLINLIGGLVTPTYPALYLIHSSVMEEAKMRGSMFDGLVGILHEIATPNVAGTELISGTFSSVCSSRVEANHDPSITATLRFTPQAELPRLWSPGICLSVKLHNSSDPEAPSVFIPSCPCFERQKKYQYTITRAACDKTSNGTSYLNRRKETDDSSDRLLLYYSTAFVSAISIAIIGSMSGFHARNSTYLQRFATMTWVTTGIYIGSFMSSFSLLFSRTIALYRAEPFLPLASRLVGRPKLTTPQVESMKTAITRSSKTDQYYGKYLTSAMYCAPTILGFVIVGLMIRDFGTCGT